MEGEGLCFGNEKNWCATGLNDQSLALGIGQLWIVKLDLRHQVDDQQPAGLLSRFDAGEHRKFWGDGTGFKVGNVFFYLPL